MENNVNEEVKPAKKIVPRIIIGAIVIIALITIGEKVYHAFTHEETDNAQVEMRLVPILSRVSGYVDKLYVEDYAKVTKGQLLLVIDSTDLQLQLDEMLADYTQGLTDVDNAKASFTNAEATLTSAKGNLDVTRLKVDKASNDFERDKSLYESNAITKRQFEDSKSNLDINSQQLETSQSDVRVAQTRLAILQSQVKKAEAMMDVRKSRIAQQRLKISYCKVKATSNGKLGKRNVDEGQFVQAGTPFFTVVNDESYWIVANFKENQLKNIPLGKDVEITVDGYPDMVIKGTVTSIAGSTGARVSLLPPDNATGNFVKVAQRIPVKIEVLDAEKYKGLLRAGMSVVVSVHITG
ncbi:MAG TPA: HlyD family secretion protein [Prolixibacteraceae bacterium]|jgi:membrane fusion protein (multidrug efflux system)